MKISEIYPITPDCDGWRVLPTGERLKLGNEVTLGNGVKLGDGSIFLTTPPQVICHPYSVYVSGPDSISVGCIRKSVAEWKNGEEPVELRNHPECLPWSNYARALQLCIAWLKNN